MKTVYFTMSNFRIGGQYIETLDMNYEKQCLINAFIKPFQWLLD